MKAQVLPHAHACARSLPVGQHLPDRHMRPVRLHTAQRTGRHTLYQIWRTSTGTETTDQPEETALKTACSTSTDPTAAQHKLLREGAPYLVRLQGCTLRMCAHSAPDAVHFRRPLAARALLPRLEAGLTLQLALLVHSHHEHLQSGTGRSIG